MGIAPSVHDLDESHCPRSSSAHAPVIRVSPARGFNKETWNGGLWRELGRSRVSCACRLLVISTEIKLGSPAKRGRDIIPALCYFSFSTSDAIHAYYPEYQQKYSSYMLPRIWVCLNSFPPFTEPQHRLEIWKAETSRYAGQVAGNLEPSSFSPIKSPSTDQEDGFRRLEGKNFF